MRTTHLPPSRCPGCGYLMDAASDAEGNARPVPGDISICFGCGTAVCFDDELRLAPLPADLVLDENTGERVERISRAIKAVRGERHT